MDKIGKFIIGGERAGDFNPEARVWGEMAVRAIVQRVLQAGGGITPAKPDRVTAGADSERERDAAEEMEGR